MSVEANKRQIGGDHYQSEYQHWDMCSRNNVPYLEGATTKYIARWRKAKKPLEDLEKAVHYIDKIMQEHEQFNYGPHGGVPICIIQKFFDANLDIRIRERAIIVSLLRSWLTIDLSEARALVLQLIGEYYDDPASAVAD